MGAKPYDLIVFGATGFTGRLVCRYLADSFDPAQLKWAAAGRSIEKLERLRQSLGPGRESTPLVVADADDEQSLAALCAQTKVVASTAGPYALCGEPLVKACAESGTDYCDLTGEVHWVRRMLDRYEPTARTSGARIVNCCGFDSIPSDLGVHFLQEQALERFGEYCAHVKMRVKAMRGGVSGGTVATFLNMVKEAAANPALRRQLKDPYLLCPEDRRPQALQDERVSPRYDADFNSWLGPFVMAPVNTRIVHRTNALMNAAWGEGFLYDEAVLTGPGLKGRLKAHSMAWTLGGLVTMSAIQPLRRLLIRFLFPSPGEGPSPETLKQGHFEFRFLGLLKDGRTLRTKVTGDADPGYGSTSKMFGRTAARLALDGDLKKEGGFWTPAALFGCSLTDTLRQYSGLTFQAEEGSPQSGAV